MNLPPTRVYLRDLPLAARTVLAVFLMSVGVGYFSALVQLHFQGAGAGKVLPGKEEVTDIYHGGGKGMSQLERVVTADETKPFNGSGSMRPAFTTRSGAWKKTIERLAKKKNIDLLKAEKELRAERGGEVSALVSWIRSGRDKDSYDTDAYFLPASLAKQPITEKFVEEDDAGKRKVKIKSIFEVRCARCHAESAGSSAAEFPLETYQEVEAYCEVETVGGGMSLKKLAQTTHVHLLGFSMLYGMTGLIFAFTSYPGWLRGLLAPLPLIAQVADISCWWLGRIDPLYAQSILVTGALVGAGLFLHIVLSLFDLFDKRGRLVIILLLVIGATTGYMVKERVIDPYLIKEGLGATATERTSGD